MKKEFIERNIKHETRAVLYWLMKAIEDMRIGESCVCSLTTATNYAARLSEQYMRASLESIDFDYGSIYQESEQQAEKEIKGDL